jgi:hypothetical protein
VGRGSKHSQMRQTLPMLGVRGFAGAVGVLMALATSACDGSSANSAPASTTARTTQSSPASHTLDASPTPATMPPTTIAGRTDGSPPCATLGNGKFGADTAHPERSPIQTEIKLAHGVRWAVCGADTSFEADFLNLRSSDYGKTWRVTDVGFAFVPHHAGDRFTVSLLDARLGRMRFVSLVAQSDTACVTSDGGEVWHCTSKSR